MTLYQVLGVRPDATQEQIKRAYRRLARENHPDAHPDESEKIERFKAAAAAYEVLSDPAARAVYDRESRPAASVQELLGKMVGGRLLNMMLPHAPAARRDGEDLIVCLSVEEGHAQVLDPRDNQIRRVPMPVVHRFARLVEFGSPGVGGGAQGVLYVLQERGKS